MQKLTPEDYELLFAQITHDTRRMVTINLSARILQLQARLREKCSKQERQRESGRLKELLELEVKLMDLWE